NQRILQSHSKNFPPILKPRNELFKCLNVCNDNVFNGLPSNANNVNNSFERNDCSVSLLNANKGNSINILFNNESELSESLRPTNVSGCIELAGISFKPVFCNVKLFSLFSKPANASLSIFSKNVLAKCNC
ncbi:hypothetical protein DERP_005414, partial [Dermatophagoides pteronyssinus]